jgi:hypothetical protein
MKTDSHSFSKQKLTFSKKPFTKICISLGFFNPRLQIVHQTPTIELAEYTGTQYMFLNPC